MSHRSSARTPGESRTTAGLLWAHRTADHRPALGGQVRASELLALPVRTSCLYVVFGCTQWRETSPTALVWDSGRPPEPWCRRSATHATGPQWLAFTCEVSAAAS